jgi:hypothetical protein
MVPRASRQTPPSGLRERRGLAIPIWPRPTGPRGSARQLRLRARVARGRRGPVRCCAAAAAGSLSRYEASLWTGGRVARSGTRRPFGRRTENRATLRHTRFAFARSASSSVPRRHLPLLSPPASARRSEVTRTHLGALLPALGACIRRHDANASPALGGDLAGSAGGRGSRRGRRVGGGMLARGGRRGRGRRRCRGGGPSRCLGRWWRGLAVARCGLVLVHGVHRRLSTRPAHR